MGERFPGRHRTVRITVLAVVALALTGCGVPALTTSPFSRKASDAISSYSAAATTIEYLHDGRLDRRYAASSLLVYRTAMQGVRGSLEGLEGAPATATLAPVLDRMAAADAVLADPCLDDGCDWNGQVRALRTAQDALAEVSQ